MLAFSLLIAAKKYLVENLARVCRAYLDTSIKDTNAFFIYESSRFFDEKELNENALNYIEKYAYRVFHKGGLIGVSKDTVVSVVKSNGLFINEADLLSSLLSWAESECHNNEMEVNGENIRTVLSDIISDIRFPLMSSQDIADIVQPVGIFTENEICHLFKQTLSTDYRSKGSKVYNDEERKPRNLKIVKISINKVIPIIWEKFTTAVKIKERIRLVGVLIAALPKRVRAPVPSIIIEIADAAEGQTLFREEDIAYEKYSNDLWLVKFDYADLYINDGLLNIHITYKEFKGCGLTLYDPAIAARSKSIADAESNLAQDVPTSTNYSAVKQSCSVVAIEGTVKFLLLHSPT